MKRKCLIQISPNAYQHLPQEEQDRLWEQHRAEEAGELELEEPTEEEKKKFYEILRRFIK